MSKVKKDLQKTKENIIDKLMESGWMPNLDYLNNPNDLETLITGKRYDHYFWISGDKNYAMTIKAQVLTVHDARRSYCKVISMKLADVEVGPSYIKSGSVGLFL